MNILESTIGYPAPQNSDLPEATVARLEGLLAGLDRLNAILALPVAPEKVSPGIVFGRFRLCSQLGAGRFGVVLLADDDSLQRQVVVKVPLPAVLADPFLRERFAREARASARLEHFGIVSVFEAGEIDDLPYLA
ncbi:MAG: serine/threonine protein kinase-related protein, partial [Planctomycetota bacterium]